MILQLHAEVDRVGQHYQGKECVGEVGVHGLSLASGKGASCWTCSGANSVNQPRRPGLLPMSSCGRTPGMLPNRSDCWRRTAAPDCRPSDPNPCCEPADAVAGTRTYSDMLDVNRYQSLAKSPPSPSPGFHMPPSSGCASNGRGHDLGRSRQTENKKQTGFGLVAAKLLSKPSKPKSVSLEATLDR